MAYSTDTLASGVVAVAVPPDAVVRPLVLVAPTSPARTALTVVVLVIAAPWAQELFYRGAVYRSLRDVHGSVATAIVVGLCFVVGHVNVYRWLPLVLVGALLSHVREVSRSLLPCLLLHSSFNAAVVACAATGWVVIGAESKVPWIALLLGWPVMCVLWYALHRQARSMTPARRTS